MPYQDRDVEITDNVLRSADCTCTIANLCMQNTKELASDIHLGLPEEIQKCFDNSSNNYIKHEEECFIRYPNTEKWVEKTRRSPVFFNQLRSFGYLMKLSLECLI